MICSALAVVLLLPHLSKCGKTTEEKKGRGCDIWLAEAFTVDRIQKTSIPFVGVHGVLAICPFSAADT
jgi:hypothetical protein